MTIKEILMTYENRRINISSVATHSVAGKLLAVLEDGSMRIEPDSSSVEIVFVTVQGLHVKIFKDEKK